MIFKSIDTYLQLINNLPWGDLNPDPLDYKPTAPMLMMDVQSFES